MEKWRLIDTGLQSAAHNIALTRALTEARNADEIPGTLRFLRYAPSALLGCRQRAREELDLAQCTAEGVGVQRRMSGGSTWLADPRQLGWELYLHRRETGRAELRAVQRRVAHAAATALAAFGVDARLRGSDEIEIGGRTAGVVAGVAEGEAVLVHGLVWMESDAERFVGFNRAALVHAGHDALREARARRVSLREAIGRVDAKSVRNNLAEAFESEFGMELAESDLTLSDQARFERALREVDTAGWVGLAAGDGAGMVFLDATHAFARGRLRAVVKYERATQTIRDVWLSGDIGLEPARLTFDLEAALRDTPRALVARRVDGFFGSRPVIHNAAGPKDFVDAITRAVGRPLAASS